MLRARLLIPALCLLFVPASASAGVIDQSGARLVVTAGDGEENHLSIMQMDTGPVLVRDTSGVVTTGCPPFSHPDYPAGYLVCHKGSPEVDLGDGDDSITISDPGTWATIGASDVDGGEGDDFIAAGAADDHFEGGAGDDTLRPYLGDDTVIGGPGDDEIDAFFGDDEIDARDGAAGDTVVCGDGDDTVQADVGDTVTADCEHVTRVGGEQPAPVGGTPDDQKPQNGSGPGPAPGVDPVPTIPQAGAGASADTVAPVLRVKRKRLRRGRVRLTLTCDEACTVTAKARRAKRRTLTLTAGTPRRVVLRVRGRAKVRLTAVDAAGNRTVRRR